MDGNAEGIIMATPERPYHITWTWDAVTSKEYASPWAMQYPVPMPIEWDFDVDLLLSNTRSQIITASYDTLEREATEKGFNFAITSIEPYVEWVTTRYETKPLFPVGQMIRAFGKLKCGATVKFDSDIDVDLHEPQLSPLIWWQWLFLAFLGFLLALYAATLLAKFLESLFIKETTSSSYIHYPDCTEEYKEETIREPDPLALVIVGGIVIAGIAVTAPIIIGALRGKR